MLNDIIEDIAEHLQTIHNIEEYSHLALPTQEEVTVAGRVCCDSNGKLNAKSVVLEGSIDTSSGKTIPVDLSQVKEYAMFPGQVVAMTGHNSTGQRFVGSKLYEVCESVLCYILYKVTHRICFKQRNTPLPCAWIAHTVFMNLYF